MSFFSRMNRLFGRWVVLADRSLFLSTLAHWVVLTAIPVNACSLGRSYSYSCQRLLTGSFSHIFLSTFAHESLSQLFLSTLVHESLSQLLLSTLVHESFSQRLISWSIAFSNFQPTLVHRRPPPSEPLRRFIII
jgi:hypothetical protein